MVFNDLKAKLSKMSKRGDYTMFSWEQVAGLIRHLLTFFGGWITANGWLDEATTQAVVGAVMTLIGVVWSWVAPEKREVL